MASSRGIVVRFGAKLGEQDTYNQQKGCLDLEFFIDLPVLDRVTPQLFIGTTAPGCFNDARWEDLRREIMRSDRIDMSDVRWPLTVSFSYYARSKT